MSAWRYIGQYLPSGEWFDWDLPLADVQITTTLSGPGRFTATLPLEVARLKGRDGLPLFATWGSAIWAEVDGQIRGGGIVADVAMVGQKVTLDCVGVSGYPSRQLWTAEPYAGIRVDPLDVVRKIWGHLQAQPAGDLGVTVDETVTPVRIGEEPEQVSISTNAGDVEFATGPYRLAPWLTDDLGREIDTLARDTPFDYRERTVWASGDRLAHRIELGYPTIGRRRDDLRFVVGENVTTRPTLTTAEYASEVHCLGAGEGRDAVHASVGARTGRLRRALAVTDASATTAKAAANTARATLGAASGQPEVTELVVADHPHAPLGAWQVGDSIRIQGWAGWHELDVWARVVSMTVRPAELSSLTMRVEQEWG